MLVKHPTGFLAWEQDVSTLQTQFEHYSDDIQTRIARTVTQVQSRDASSDELSIIAEEHLSSEYSPQRVRERSHRLVAQVEHFDALVKVLEQAGVKIIASFADYSQELYDRSVAELYVLVLVGMDPSYQPRDMASATRFASFARNRANQGKQGDMRFLFVHYDSFMFNFTTPVTSTSVFRYVFGALATATFDPPGEPTRPSSPTLVSGTAIGPSEDGATRWLSLHWNEPDYPPPGCKECPSVLRYVVKWTWQDWETDSSWIIREGGPVESSQSTVHLEGFMPGERYRFQVAAINNEGTGPFSVLSDYITASLPGLHVSVHGGDVPVFSRWGPTIGDHTSIANKRTIDLILDSHDSSQMGSVFVGNISCPIVLDSIPSASFSCVVPQQNESFFLLEDGTLAESKTARVAVKSHGGDILADGSLMYRRVKGVWTLDGGQYVCAANDGQHYVGEEATSVCGDKTCTSYSCPQGWTPKPHFGSVFSTEGCCQRISCLPPSSSNEERGFNDDYRGWYDVQRCGRCNDYCRWVGTSGSAGNPSGILEYKDSWWSCRLAGTSDSGTNAGHFHTWDFQKCASEGAATPPIISLMPFSSARQSRGLDTLEVSQKLKPHMFSSHVSAVADIKSTISTTGRGSSRDSAGSNLMRKQAPRNEAHRQVR